ncbi:MAG: Na(+)/H(+) antiporter subunit D [Halopseudomonas sp.]
MIEPMFPPGLVLFLVVLLPLVGNRGHGLLVLGLPLLTLALVWSMPANYLLTLSFMGLELTPVSISATGRLFATVFALMAFVGALYGYRQASKLEMAAGLVNAGSAIGVSLAGDLITLFVFWELLALSSTLVLWAANTTEARRASMRYLLVHLFGGMVLLAGISGHVVATGSIALVPLQADSVAHWLLLGGLLVNAGAPPLSAWVADSYPEASPSGTVFLSAFTTKTAVFALIMVFPGEKVLIGVGLYMMFYGIIYALLENDMRRILAYSIVNQVGFMVTAIGIGTEMAINGAAAHAFAHIIYKGLLLMAAGAVLYRTGKRKCTDLGGLFQSMPWTTLLGIVGALSISAFPLTSGFISKSMISQAAADQQLVAVWLALVAGSAGVFLHAGIKFPWFVFFQKDSGLRPPEPPANMLWAMTLFAFGCLALGFYPAPLYAMLPYPVSYSPYTGAHLVAQLQLLLFAGLAFFVMLPQMKRTLTISLDFDWFYRRWLKRLSAMLVDQSSQGQQQWEAAARHRIERLNRWLVKHLGLNSRFARGLPTGSMVLWVTVLLWLLLLVFYR